MDDLTRVANGSESRLGKSTMEEYVVVGRGGDFREVVLKKLWMRTMSSRFSRPENSHGRQCCSSFSGVGCLFKDSSLWNVGYITDSLVVAA